MISSLQFLPKVIQLVRIIKINELFRVFMIR